MKHDCLNNNYFSFGTEKTSIGYNNAILEDSTF
jgi:hypothetical protein